MRKVTRPAETHVKKRKLGTVKNFPSRGDAEQAVAGFPRQHQRRGQGPYHGLIKLKSGCTHCPALRQRAASDEQQDSSSRQLQLGLIPRRLRGSSVRGPVLFESQKCGHQCSHASKLLKRSVAERQGLLFALPANPLPYIDIIAKTPISIRVLALRIRMASFRFMSNHTSK